MARNTDATSSSMPTDLATRLGGPKRTLHLLCALSVAWSLGTLTRAEPEQEGQTNLTVVVTDAQTGLAINQARLTLEFVEPGNPAKLKRSKKLSYSAKTNTQGRYKFPSIPTGTVRLIVTAERHQAFSKEFDLDKGTQVIEVKLRKPQPLL
jgi:carboxypeptidase family protein